MVDYVTAEYGLTPEQAYVVCSVAADLRISQVVDVPNYLVSMILPEGIFQTSGPTARRHGQVQTTATATKDSPARAAL
jgi:acetamidase/formamidase